MIKFRHAVCIICAILFSLPALSQRFPESDYAMAWCDDNDGKQEYALPDQARIDCWIPSKHWAVEVERISKPYEAVGQALFYAAAMSQMTKTPALPVVVFFDDNGDMTRFNRYFRRFKLATTGLEFLVFCLDMQGNNFLCPD
ncbi:MAG: hypothetical protein ACR2P4_03060 [Gammaproteobacteria bacterium]